MEKEIVKSELRLSAMIEDVRDRLTRSADERYSRVMEVVDAFMLRSMTIRNDQAIVIHRMDRLEARVAELENWRRMWSK
jgi:hypothetical protein